MSTQAPASPAPALTLGICPGAPRKSCRTTANASTGVPLSLNFGPHPLLDPTMRSSSGDNQPQSFDPQYFAAALASGKFPTHLSGNQ